MSPLDSTSHDWHPLSPLPADLFLALESPCPASSSLSVSSLHVLSVSLSRLVHLGFVVLVLAAALVQLVLADDLEEATRPQPDSARPAAADPPACGYTSGGFDRRKMLQPSFGQTFKAKRVGACMRE
ncbi:hypothetical protein GUITHDRAFT_103463 [Guillardia theta CCMP2712]|uniref:Uncharacterized protein n=1 Tax=Guillardia theta (strain CCMP2712) TaxID=905079 RepID=L1JQP2_GUITC|nr:hypothetical protein GUITHDRAFT_103463 [Guillardia theta CCMP2712]EKX50876.1 hypothetical protein GUITHDRAFT_103463 [Guillardia theta CCMP2712]|eukprot:XP_005837856.1 hypothetical protein GUITHDRAFT_103463 [Guillardia theta CCMP2712]